MVISLIQLLFVTDIKNNDFIIYTGWVMISIVCINVGVNFIISLIYNIRTKCKRSSKKSAVVPQISAIVINNSYTSRIDTHKLSSANIFIRHNEEYKRPSRKKARATTKIREIVSFSICPQLIN